jgi:hypothetical protein
VRALGHAARKNRAPLFSFYRTRGKNYARRVKLQDGQLARVPNGRQQRAGLMDSVLGWTARSSSLRWTWDQEIFTGPDTSLILPEVVCDLRGDTEGFLSRRIA